MSKLRNANDDFPFRLFYLGEVLPAFRLTFFSFFFAFTSGPLFSAPCETFCTDVLLRLLCPRRYSGKQRRASINRFAIDSSLRHICSA